MSNTKPIPFDLVRSVGQQCYCLCLQRTARLITRKYDDAFRPLGITSVQYSLLMMLNRPEAPSIRTLADDMGVDRTTVTAVLKPLQRRKLLQVHEDKDDQRVRRVTITSSGKEIVLEAYQRWQGLQSEIDAMQTMLTPDAFRMSLRNLQKQ